MKRHLQVLLFLMLLGIGLFVITACRSEPSDYETESLTDDFNTIITMETSTEPESIADTREPETYFFDDDIHIETETVTSEVESGEYYVYAQDFSEPIAENDPDWYINEVSDVSNGNLTSVGSTHCYLSSKHKAKADLVTLTVDVQANRPNAPAHDSGFIALRLPSYDNQYAAVGQNGIWLAFQNQKVGIINGWANVVLFDCGFDFTQARRVYVEDNQKDNTISIYTNDGSNRSFVFSITITDDRTVMVKDKNGNTEIEATFTYDIPSSGHIALWAHQNNGGVIFDNLTIEWGYKAPEPYVPTDSATLRDLYSDTWVGMDDENRFINYGMDDVEDKLVGIFYQIWHISSTTTYPDQIIYDHYKIYQQGGHAAVKDAYSKGPEGWGHYWAQPYFGYYLTNDQWVIRKHASMLVDIGVDFIYLDVTNGNPLTSSYMAIFKEYHAMRQEGMDTPDICFFMSDNADMNLRVFEDIWDNIYSTGQYSDLYVMYKGKPLLLGNVEKIEDTAALETFTIRRCWALRENVNGGRDIWTWMHETPQPISKNTATREEEEISISAGILANTSSGRSNVNGRQPDLITMPDGTVDIFQFELETTGQGLFFAEQMERAAQADTYVLLINTWNEWTASHWKASGYTKIANTMIDWTYDYYVDCFNPEFSRDIEPMADGFGDNYYYQLARFLRAFKGSRAVPQAAGQMDMELSADLSAWENVWPEYMDTKGDTFHRDAVGFGGFFHYTNESGRNDIISAKVSKTDSATYFLVVCDGTITAPMGSNWMNLYINVDLDYSTGWCGYDIVINRDGTKAANGKVTIEKFVDNEWKLRSIGEGEISINGNYLVIQVDTALCGLSSSFDFKWADNSTTDGEIMQFLDQGDAAPNARFNYAYRSESTTPTFNAGLDSYLAGGAAFSDGKAYMAAEDGVYRLYDGSTNAKARMYMGRLFVPVTALGNLKDASVTVSADDSSATWIYGGKNVVFTADSANVKVGKDICIIPVAPFMENGVLYVPLNAAAFVVDLHYYGSSDGTSAILSPKAEAPEGEDAGRLFGALNRSF